MCKRGEDVIFCQQEDDKTLGHPAVVNQSKKMDYFKARGVTLKFFPPENENIDATAALCSCVRIR